MNNLTSALPEMPEPLCTLRLDYGGTPADVARSRQDAEMWAYDTEEVFTADQLRAYGLACFNAGRAEGGKDAPNLGSRYEPTMNIYAKPGTVVRFRAGGGYDSEKEMAVKAGFVRNQTYTVKRCDVDHSKTHVTFDEIAGRWNSCLFADLDEAAGIQDALEFALKALADEHGPSDFEAECNLCQAYRKGRAALPTPSAAMTKDES